MNGKHGCPKVALQFNRGPSPSLWPSPSWGLRSSAVHTPGRWAWSRSRWGGWIAKHNCRLVAAHVGTTGHLGPKKAILNSFPIALNLFERNSHGLCLGLRFPDLWKAKAAASLEPTPGQLLRPSLVLSGQARFHGGSPGSEPGSLRGHGAPGRTR